MITQGYHARLLPEWRLRIRKAAAVQALVAANALVGVLQPISALVVELRRDAEHVVEQIHARHEAQLDVRTGTSDEHRGIADDDFVRRQNAVAIEIVEAKNTTLPHTEERISRNFANVGADDRRDRAKAYQLVVVDGVVELAIETDPIQLQHLRSQARFKSAVLD